jgi:signal transduction histidine kinase
MMRGGPSWRMLWRESPLRSALGKRILIWLLLLSLVPLFVSNTTGYLASSSIIHRLARRDLEALTAVQAQHVRDEIERLLVGLASAARNDRLLMASAAALRDTASRPGLQSGATGLAAEELELLRRQLQVFTAVELVDPSGVIVAASPPFASGMRWRDRAVLRRAAAGYAFAVERTGAPPAPRLLFAAAMFAPDTTRPVIVVGSVEPGAIGPALQIPSLIAGAVEGFIVDEAGLPVLVSYPRGAVDYTRPLPSHRALAGGAPSYQSAGGAEVIGSAHAVPGYPLSFIAEIPVRAALGGLRGLRLLSAVLGLAFVLVVIAVAWIVSRGVVRPVYALVGATERIGQGDLAASVAVGQRDELGLLAERFNAMAAQLRESAARIRDLHEEEMRRAEQLATVGELAAGVAHELKTPLLGIAGGVQLLGRHLGPADAEGRRLVDELMLRVGRMEAAVHGLLSYARPSPARRSRLGLNAIVERALALVEPRAERSAVTIRRTLADSLPPVLVDPDQIGQVVVNLALNGVEAMRSGGLLMVETRRVDRGVELSVGDCGPGVTVEERERIFRPFFTTKDAGTGLGLAIVRQIVDRHGGRVALTERAGGAEFVVFLPVDAQPDASGGGL